MIINELLWELNIKNNTVDFYQQLLEYNFGDFDSYFNAHLQTAKARGILLENSIDSEGYVIKGHFPDLANVILNLLGYLIRKRYEKTI